MLSMAIIDRIIFTVHGLSYGVDSDGTYPFVIKSKDGKRSMKYVQDNHGLIDSILQKKWLEHGRFMIITCP